VTQPKNETIAEILGRLLARLKAKDTLLVAHRVGQSPPEWVFNDLLRTNGIETEAGHLMKVLKPKRRTPRDPKTTR
jgi:hypothetical protein